VPERWDWRKPDEPSGVPLKACYSVRPRRSAQRGQAIFNEDFPGGSGSRPVCASLLEGLPYRHSFIDRLPLHAEPIPIIVLSAGFAARRTGRTGPNYAPTLIAFTVRSG
jgi:hypothetical protein